MSDAETEEQELSIMNEGLMDEQTGIGLPQMGTFHTTRLGVTVFAIRSVQTGYEYYC